MRSLACRGLPRGRKPFLCLADESADERHRRFQRESPTSVLSRRSPAAGSTRRFPATRFTHGFTLIEILISLTILGISLGIVALAVTTLEPRPDAEVPRRISEARTGAIRNATPITLEFTGGVRLTLHGDGSATPARIWDGAAYWRVDPWTGAVHRE